MRRRTHARAGAQGNKAADRTGRRKKMYARAGIFPFCGRRAPLGPLAGKRRARLGSAPGLGRALAASARTALVTRGGIARARRVPPECRDSAGFLPVFPPSFFADVRRGARLGDVGVGVPSLQPNRDTFQTCRVPSWTIFSTRPIILPG
ncbi:hypothetical protein GQ55_5G071100 [Panicum hallii var. hallii]|uniref:Uncharacterized protein n=1 Tax=Panicum hallii var. hallii TaxID=1504633 RepID=A0A2T7DDN7_9POAL|nr:hypothetical protein GQ55_5G071100 [Panicum hallii var. hallii]